MTEAFEEILQFWFGPLCEGFAVESKQSLWWGGQEEVDRELDELFGCRVRQAMRGELEAWSGNPRGRLALILLLDQFTRSIYRGSADAFAGDSRALDLCQRGIELGHDRGLEFAERLFFYMPLEHAESLEAQDLHIETLEELRREVPFQRRATIDNALDYAHQHRDLIVRFGRFPHRNDALERVSTPEELAYLNQSHRRWGQ
ncbi:hypothetical protein GCM10011348_14420 [Marinobacterium nitratireducens]|uniref:Transmembrane protein n=1 Tax=Marinobacterium nitratireducens TaxID=518897 RepID=A0A917ZD66_9GAMM|nr:DUF924 family protein [Marinobacterium nitratireducens]GGO79642.1 hypothetical protein GCM10011348_14420 [Marinobacterium nitratireducens]